MTGKYQIQYRNQEQIDNVFSYHAPKDVAAMPTQKQRYETIREQARQLAIHILESCPESHERDVAIDNLRAAVMWANSSIACNE